MVLTSNQPVYSIGFNKKYQLKKAELVDEIVMNENENPIQTVDVTRVEQHRQTLLFGDKKQDNIEFIYSRYAMGDPVSLIAADLGIAESEVRRKMRTQPDKYEDTKKQRECFLNIRLRRSLSLVDAWNLRQLELLIEGVKPPTAEVVKELGRIAKDIFNRLQLQEGKATEIVKVEDKRLTIDEMKAKIKKIEAAGDGINKE